MFDRIKEENEVCVLILVKVGNNISIGPPHKKKMKKKKRKKKKERTDSVYMVETSVC